MRPITQIFFVFIAICLVAACKKEAVNEVDLVKTKFIGRWPLKIRILDTLKNGVSSKPDTTNLSPIDTLVFAADGKLTSTIYNTTYSFDALAENVTFNTTTPIVWHIDFLRISSIILSRKRTEKIGADTFEYYQQDQLIK